MGLARGLDGLLSSPVPDNTAEEAERVEESQHVDSKVVGWWEVCLEEVATKGRGNTVWTLEPDFPGRSSPSAPSELFDFRRAFCASVPSSVQWG